MDGFFIPRILHPFLFCLCNLYQRKLFYAVKNRSSFGYFSKLKKSAIFPLLPDNRSDILSGNTNAPKFDSADKNSQW